MLLETRGDFEFSYAVKSIADSLNDIAEYLNSKKEKENDADYLINKIIDNIKVKDINTNNTKYYVFKHRIEVALTAEYIYENFDIDLDTAYKISDLVRQDMNNDEVYNSIELKYIQEYIDKGILIPKTN